MPPSGRPFGPLNSALGVVYIRLCLTLRVAFSKTGVVSALAKALRLEPRFEERNLLGKPSLNKKGPPLRVSLFCLNMVGRAGFEPATNWLKANCSTN